MHETMEEYRRKLANLESELTRQAAGLQGLQDSCSEVYNHIVAVFNAVGGVERAMAGVSGAVHR